MDLWIGLAHLRPCRERRPDADFVGLYQYIGGPAASAGEFCKVVEEAAGEHGFLFVDLDQIAMASEHRGQPDLAEFIETVETERVLTFGPGYVYENDDG